MFDNKDVGAVGGLILDPKSNYYKLPILASNRIEDINLGLNIQWFLHKDNNIKEVDHLYSSFIYRKDLAEYCSNLSQVCHREETIMTYNLKRKGYKLLVNPNCITWHFRFPEGGIRDNSRKEDFDHDELIFKNKLIEWGIKPTKYKEFVLDSGLGDHIIFKSLLPLIYEKYKDYKIVLYVCYPLVFEKENVIIDSIANAYLKFGNLDKFNLYKFMADINHKTHLKDAYIKLYNL